MHERFRECLRGVTADGLLLRHDLTQPMGAGTRLARTRVTRCLIGEPVRRHHTSLLIPRRPDRTHTAPVSRRLAAPTSMTMNGCVACTARPQGITYFYLGVRMFAHPWSGKAASQPCKAMRALSRKLTERASASGGSAEASAFNLVLLNRMAPEEAKTAKHERDYNMGALSVAWHADCALRDFSTITVYCAHHPSDQPNFDQPPPPPAPEHERPWRVALRVVKDAEGPIMRAANGAAGRRDTSTPAVLVPCHDGDCYHMLHDFNHHHQVRPLT
jgi:hypothetical protein